MRTCNCYLDPSLLEISINYLINCLNMALGMGST